MNYLMSIRFTQEVPVSDTHYESGSHFQEAKVGEDEFNAVQSTLETLAELEGGAEMLNVNSECLRAFLRRIYPIVEEAYTYDLMVQFRQWDDTSSCPNYLDPINPPLLTAVFEVFDGVILDVNATVTDDTKHDEVPVVQPAESVAGTKS